MELVVMKMAILTLVVTLAMLKLSGGEEYGDLRTTTLEDHYPDLFQLNFEYRFFKDLRYVLDPYDLYRRDLPPYVKENKMVNEIIRYIHLIQTQTYSRFLKDLGDITTDSIYKDLKEHCSEDVEDLRDELTDVTCVHHRLMELLLPRAEKAAEVTMEMCPALCSQENLTICSTEGCSCDLDHGQRFGQVMKEFVREVHGFTTMSINKEYWTNILDIIEALMWEDIFWTSSSFDSAKSSWVKIARNMLIAPSIELFGYENLVNQEDYDDYLLNSNSSEESAWGVIGSNTGTFDLPCSKYEELYSRNSSEFQSYYKKCDNLGIRESVHNLLSCVHKNSTSVPLAWATVPDIYVHTQCLCLAYDGKDCGVKAPQGVNDSTYCLSVLLRDLQRQVSFRPAATYLDYAFMSPITVCKLTYLLQLIFDYNCYHYMNYSPQPVWCYFTGLLNKEIKCTERIILNTSNLYSLCDTIRFMRLVLCKDGTDYNKPVTYYRFGDSPLVLTLHYVDVGLRLLTLVTYLVCRQLRNLPGKLLIGYQMVALTRLLAVRSILEDLELAVRVDVSMDLASTLWLTAYLHFVTHCITTLTPPDSMSLCESRMVLLRSSLFGCALPVALSAAFFTMDEVLEVHVQVGQLLFVLCIYAALLANIIMLYINFKVYYEIRSDAHKLQRNLTARQVFADLFNFVLKTSVLSGAGILFRLVFTQIPGLVDVLSYYHALGTFHGLLLFLLYGCNREARLFWLSVWRTMRSRCHLGRNTSLRRNSLELQQRPV